jgi:hypothetical protein
VTVTATVEAFEVGDSRGLSKRLTTAPLPGANRQATFFPDFSSGFPDFNSGSQSDAPRDSGIGEG